MIAEALAWGWALPSIVILLLFIAELKREGQTLNTIPPEAKWGIIIICIVYPLGIGSWIYHKWGAKDDGDSDSTS